ncbi:MAG TPA: disulfide bond formation protein DsbA [Verrucomicrobiales bacterium]|nr:disulfide bond formation protein DsbA [Verrucomicrobiales bacterium]
MKITYYLEVISSWCFWAEPAWAELKRRYAGRVEFEWKLALMDESGLPATREQAEWFYRRSGTLMRSPVMLNAGWFEAGRKEYLPPNLVAEAAKDLGVRDDRVRMALAWAAMIQGRKVGRWEVAVEVAAEAVPGLDAGELRRLAGTPGILRRAKASTAEFHAMKVSQRPTFLLENAIGDRVVLSGVVALEPLVAAADALLNDASGYASFRSHFGDPPPD